MLSFRSRVALLIAALFLIVSLKPCPAVAALSVTRATLRNGLKIVVVRDPLAPAVTTVLNYKAGSDEQQFPGQAHALEHMMFRGSKTLSQSQMADISQLMGDINNADTQSDVTQYYYSVPSQNVDLALRLEASRAKDLLVPQSLWNIERGAIMNEVTQTESYAFTKLLTRTIIPALFAGTAYANDDLGTIDGFKHRINAPELLAFYKAWYHPNNAVFVIAGDVDGPSTIRAVTKYFGSIPAAALPARPKVFLKPVKAATLRVVSTRSYSFIARAFRMPGYNSPDYAAGQILESVLNNRRANLYGLVASGKALFVGFDDREQHPLASASVVYTGVPATTNPEAALAELDRVLDGYRRSGVPAGLVDSAKRRAVASAEFRGNSIDGLAFEWSDAVAKEGLNSPDDMLVRTKRVTVGDVNRVLRKYLRPHISIAAFSIPKNTGKIDTDSASGPSVESNKATILHHDPLPAWALRAFKHLHVPGLAVQPVASTLPNGIRLIVQPLHVTHTLVVRGSVRSNEMVQASPAKLGVDAIVAQLFEFGSATYNRIRLREELDKIAADVSAGPQFSLDVLSSDFGRGMQLLADEELHPAFLASDFLTVRQQVSDGLAGQATAPEHLVEVALNGALYPPGDPMRRFATAQTASAVTLADVRNYYGTVYRPDMTTIVIIGDTTPSAARALVQKYFGAWSALGAKPDVSMPPVPPNEAANVTIPDPIRVQSDVQLAQVSGLTRSDPDWPAMQVANTVFGGGDASTLFHDLRDEHGYVYGAFSRLDSQQHRSIFAIDFASDPEKIIPAQNLAMADVAALSRVPVSETELLRAKSMLISAIPLNMMSSETVALNLITFTELGLPPGQSMIDARRELMASPESVRAAFAKWIRPGGFARIIHGPPPR